MNQSPSLLEPEIRKDAQMPQEIAPRKHRRARIILILLALIIVVGAAFGIARVRRAAGHTNAANAPTPDAGPVEVSAAEVVSRSSIQSVEVVGSLLADEEVVVSAQVAGELSSLNVDFGSLVKQGQIIAQIDRRDAELKLAQAQATLNQTMARIGMKEGQPFDPQQNADVRIAKAQLDWAKMDLDRSTKLIENGDISRSVYDQAVINHQMAQARLQAALDQVQQQLALVEQQKASLALAKKGEVDTVVRSPINGSVKEKHAGRGTYLPVNGKIVTLVRLDPLRVRADIPESSAGAVRVGQMTSFTVDAFPGRTFAARIARIAPSLSEQTRSLTVEAELSNPGSVLRPGMFAKSQIVVNPNARAILVPQKAVSYVAGISKVFVIENGTANERIIKTGASDGDLIEVTSGLNQGEVVATSNLDRLQTGTKVRK